ncbi:MAG TPA: DUF1559 domain-containing protein, partial [Lacipirellulaceae bacterium]|nr:DUF1559 domain-containing protein [Lacipirellulaceae bacterium]
QWGEDFDLFGNWIPGSGVPSVNDPARGGPGFSGRGWIVEILPQMEDQARYQGIVSGLKTTRGRQQFAPPRAANGTGMGAPEIRPFVTQVVPWLACPSDTAAGELSTECWYWDGIAVPTTSYRGSIGDSAMTDGNARGSTTVTTFPPGFGSLPDCHNTAECNGLFGRNTSVRPVTLKSITDGQSNTFLLGETVVSQDFHSMAFFSDGDFATCGIPLNLFLLGLDVTTLKQSPNWMQTRGFKSLHPGGSQFAMADGSTQYINEGIDGAVYRGLATRAGDEVVTLSK